jgi:membrane protein required for colicin V production
LLGIWGAVKFSSITASYLAGVINVDEQVLAIISFAITFILIVIGVHFVAKTVESIAKAVALGFVNKIFGALFGVFKVAFVISVILVVINAANKNMGFISPKFKEDSLLYSPLSQLAPKFFKYLDFEDVEQGVKKKSEIINI